MDNIANNGVACRGSIVILIIVALIAAFTSSIIIDNHRKNKITYYLLEHGVSVKTEMENDRIVQGWVLDLSSRKVMVDLINTKLEQNGFKKSSVEINQTMQSIISLNGKLWSIFVSISNDEGKSRFMCERLN